MKIERKKIQGRIVTLEPLSAEHLNDFVEAGKDTTIWKWMTFSLDESNSTRSFVNHVSLLPDKGTASYFAIRCNYTHKVIGGSGYWHIDHKNRKLEIGGSWLVRERQGTGANTDSKYLLLENAFESMAFRKVSFSIDTRNEKSIAAIKKIGAVKEGVLRCDLQLYDGRERDSAIFSILSDEWPRIKEALKIRLNN